MNESERGELEKTESGTRELTFTKHCCQIREPDQWRVNVNRLQYITSSLPAGKWRLFLPEYNVAFHSLFLYLPLVFLICTSSMRCHILREIYWRSEMKDISREIRLNGKILPRYFSFVRLWEATWHFTFNLHLSRSTLRSNRFRTRLLLYSFMALRKFPSTIRSRHRT